MRVLNLYSGIGGNRRLWEDVDVTDVEINPKIAAIYQDFFPDDNVIVGDAHQYLLEHFKEYDFIWSSPPCPTHSKAFYAFGVCGHGYPPKYVDMTLYQEIVLLKHNFKGKYCVENVNPFYKPLYRAASIGRHLYWANFNITKIKVTNNAGICGHTKEKTPEYFVIKKYNITAKEKQMCHRNCVEPKVGLHILNESKRNVQPELFQ